MNIAWVMATRDRHLCVERVLRTFLDQNYEGNIVLWIYNNSREAFELNMPPLPENKKIILQHQFKDSKTNDFYENVGFIYNDIMDQLPTLKEKTGWDIDAITFTEDDDLYLPIHTKEGAKGMKKARGQDKFAYKPFQSYYKTKESIQLMHNVFEPSIFIDYEYITHPETRMRETSMDYHFGWLQPLIDNNSLLVDEEGVPTLIYDWSGEIPVYKLSGSGDNSVKNYNNYKFYSKAEKSILTPISEEKAKEYYKIN